VRSFADLLQSLRADGFATLAGVDSAEVCVFVDSVESAEQGAKGSKRDHGVHFEKNTRVLKIESGIPAIAPQGFGRLEETNVG
jgi:hypothetical protein